MSVPTPAFVLTVPAVLCVIGIAAAGQFLAAPGPIRTLDGPPHVSPGRLSHPAAPRSWLPHQGLPSRQGTMDLAGCMEWLIEHVASY
ncbi:hypothetical protein [Nonomuraea longicatena]|uniref:Uncharacterized protein n=1 Tax=Nonomuraea longicatena TaxID=83682 RepID=A0ABP4BRE3_9ACTN